MAALDKGLSERPQTSKVLDPPNRSPVSHPLGWNGRRTSNLDVKSKMRSALSAILLLKTRTEPRDWPMNLTS